MTTYAYDTRGRLTEVNTPHGTANGTTISFTYDADGNRLSKTVTTGGPVPTTVIKYVYQAGRIAYETDGAGITLATFTYDAMGTPASVQVGATPATAPRYYYVYNRHGDVVALTDASGNTVATYSYDVFGGVTALESLPGGWSNPYRYDGKERVRYDVETSLYWMSVRAYDPTLGRFLSRDPLNRQPLVWATQPYVYGGNNPLRYTDPSGQVIVDADGDQATALIAPRTSVQTTSGSNGSGTGGGGGGPAVLAPPTHYDCPNTCLAKQYADGGGTMFTLITVIAGILGTGLAFAIAALTGGFGIFVAGAIAGAAASIIVAATLAASQFFTFNEERGKNPVYFKNFRQTIATMIGAPADGLFFLGTALTGALHQPLSVITDDGQAFVAALKAGTITTGTVAATGFTVGLAIGALASLLVLPFVAELYLSPMEQLETGAFQNCGNNSFAIQDGILCPGGYY